MKYYLSNIYYLDVLNNKEIGELTPNDIDYKKSTKEFVFSRRLLATNYSEYLTSIFFKDMVRWIDCYYRPDGACVSYVGKALQREIPFFIDVVKDEITEEQAKNVIDSFGGEKEYLEELEEIVTSSTRSLALRKNIRENWFKKLDGKTLKKKRHYL